MTTISNLPIEIVYELCVPLTYSEMPKFLHVNKKFSTFFSSPHFQKLYQSKLKKKALRCFRKFKDKDMCLLHAALKPNIQVLKFLLQDRGFIPSWILIDVSRSGNTHSLEVLLNSFPGSTSFPIEILWTACEYGHPEIISFLIKDPRFDPSQDCCQALILACIHENVDCVKVLLKDKRVDPAIRNNFCFRHACRENNLDLIDLLLLEPTVNPAAHDNDAFIEACAAGNVSLVSKLLRLKCISPEAQDNQALSISSLRWHVQIVKLLWNDERVKRQHIFCYNPTHRRRITDILQNES